MGRSEVGKASVTNLILEDELKSLHETLCYAQTAIGSNQRLSEDLTASSHIARLQRMLNEIERQRPLGPNGKHGDLHTDTCGCLDKGVTT